MSFLNNVILPSTTPNSPAPSVSSKGSFLNSVVMPPANYVTPEPTPTPPSQNLFSRVIGSINSLADKGASAITNSQTPNTAPKTPSWNMADFAGQSIGNTPTTDKPASSYKYGMPKEDLLTAPIEDIPWYMQPGRAVHDTVKNTFQNENQAFNDLSDSLANVKTNSDGTVSTTDLTTKQQFVDHIAKFANVGLAIVNSAFLPVTASFTAGAKLPVIGSGVQVINDLFGKAGDVGSGFGDWTTDQLPISDKSKEALRPVLQQTFGLLSQLALGKVSADMVEPKLAGMETKIRKIVADSQDVETKVPINKPNNVKGGFLDSVVKPEEVKPTETAPIETKTAPEATPKISPETKPIAPEDNLINVRTTKSASDINQRLVDQGLKNIPEEQLAKYEPDSYKADVVRVKDLLDTDLQKARDMATGKVPISPEIKYPQILFNAVEEYGIKNADVGLLKDLANSKLSTQLSESAQTLGSHGFNDNPNSPVTAIREITKAREDVIKTRKQDVTKIKKETVKQMREEIKKVKPKQTWSEFVKSVQC